MHYAFSYTSNSCFCLVQVLCDSKWTVFVTVDQKMPGVCEIISLLFFAKSMKAPQFTAAGPWSHLFLSFVLLNIVVC